MDKYEEIFFISAILSKANSDNSVPLNDLEDWKDLLLSDRTKVLEDYLFKLNEEGILNYEEIGDEGFKPIIICSVKPETIGYLKKLIIEIEIHNSSYLRDMVLLNKRITDILTFNPNRLSEEINSTEKIISQTKEQLKSNPILQPLSLQLEQIEIHFNSLSKIANNYEDIYKNIILPVREEGKAGVRQTVKWAIISIIASTIFSLIISSMTKQ